MTIGKHLSQEERERIVKLRKSTTLEIRDIAERLNAPRSCIMRVLQKEGLTGDPRNTQ